jgi:hypothetical protein
MHTLCSACGLRFEKGPGYFLGATYVNYGLTVLLVAPTYIVLAFVVGVPTRPLLFGLLAFSVLFPLWFFRYARSIWLAFDEVFDPSPPSPTTDRVDGPTVQDDPPAGAAQ